MEHDKYWAEKYLEFVYDTLGEEQKYYEKAEQYNIAKYTADNIRHLLEKKDKKLKEIGKDYVLFMYVNHELNKFDPIGLCYPVIRYEYEVYAWNIVDMYKEYDTAIFETKVEEYLYEVCDMVCANYHIEELELTAKNIVKVLNKLYSNR